MYKGLLGCVLKGSSVTEHMALHVVNLEGGGFQYAFKYLTRNKNSKTLFHGCVSELGKWLTFLTF